MLGSMITNNLYLHKSDLNTESNQLVKKIKPLYNDKKPYDIKIAGTQKHDLTDVFKLCESQVFQYESLKPYQNFYQNVNNQLGVEQSKLKDVCSMYNLNRQFLVSCQEIKVNMYDSNPIVYEAVDLYENVLELSDITSLFGLKKFTEKKKFLKIKRGNPKMDLIYTNFKGYSINNKPMYIPNWATKHEKKFPILRKFFLW